LLSDQLNITGFTSKRVIVFKKDSLKKTLLMNYPGCKSAVEAFEFAKSQKIETASQASEEYESMRQIIIDVELAINGFDIDLMDGSLRAELRDMPLRTLDEAVLWRDAWIRTMKRLLPG
jgi:hypothetical protein